MRRREFVKNAGIASLAIATPRIVHGKEISNMFGIIVKLIAVPSERDNLIGILLEGTQGMPGCIQYVISKDIENEDAIWITEVWKDKESHQSSMTLQSVQEAIAKGKPLIASFGDRHMIEPVGGQGI